MVYGKGIWPGLSPLNEEGSALHWESPAGLRVRIRWSKNDFLTQLNKALENKDKKRVIEKRKGKRY